MGDEIKVSNSMVGVINTGKIETIESIYLNTSNLANTGHTELVIALRKVTEATNKSQELTQEQQSELLEQLEEIARQANTSPNKRAAPAVIKAVLSSIAMTIGTGGGLAEIWSTWGPAIKAFFGF